MCLGSCMILQGCVRYGTYRGIPAVYTAGITSTGHFGKFGTTSIPVPETSISSVHPYRYREYRYRTEHTLGFLCLFGSMILIPGTRCVFGSMLLFVVGMICVYGSMLVVYMGPWFYVYLDP